MGEKIAKFIDCYVPTETCNLRCHYCYIALQKKFGSKIADFNREPDEIRRAFSKERLGGICLINICAGGETLLAPKLPDAIQALLMEGHYVMIVTNGTLTKRLEAFWRMPEELRKRLFFKFSFHYLEMKRLNMLDIFASNVNRTWESGCSITVEVTPSDELIPYINELKTVCIEKFGALCHITIARDDTTNGIDLLTSLSEEEYRKTWEAFDSPMLTTKLDFYKRPIDEFCYAGKWSCHMDFITGDIRQCYCGKKIGNIYDLSQPIAFEAIGCCRLPYCYNGHAFMTLGVAEGVDAIPFVEIRDRVALDGRHWVNEQMQGIMSQRLYENNKCFDKKAKRKIVMHQYPVKLASPLIRKIKLLKFEITTRKRTNRCNVDL